MTTNKATALRAPMVKELAGDILGWIERWNADPKAFVSTETAEDKDRVRI